MNIAEHKLSLFRQIDQLPEDLLIELENIIARLLLNRTNPDLSDTMKVEDFYRQQTEEVKALWQEGIKSGDAQPLVMQAIRAEALRRYNAMNKENGKAI
jgi:uncharacterized protein YoaH (UPF0181 family)